MNPLDRKYFPSRVRVAAADTCGMKLQPTLTGFAPTMDVSGILQLIATHGLSGTFRFGDHFVRFLGGLVCATSGEPVETVAAILRAEGEFTFRIPPHAPQGPHRLSITGLLLEASRLADERAVRS